MTEEEIQQEKAMEDKIKSSVVTMKSEQPPTDAELENVINNPPLVPVSFYNFLSLSVDCIHKKQYKIVVMYV